MTYTMTDTSPYNAALGDDEAWGALVYDRGTATKAQEYLHSQLAELRDQRKTREATLSGVDYKRFLAKQAGYAALLHRRLGQTKVLLAGDNPVPALRKRSRHLSKVVAALTTAIDDYLEERLDEEELDDVLDDLTLEANGETYTLREALEKLPRYAESGRAAIDKAREG